MKLPCALIWSICVCFSSWPRPQISRRVRRGAGMALASASERIRLMEQSLGAPLLERHRRGVRATPAGATLVSHAQLVIQQLERMRGELSEYADGFRGRVRLFANTTATAEFVPATLAAFLSQHPQIDIDLEERSS